ncbi:hypothetical protein QYF36_017646 [Acer negundo]|nr:hypothetical protein QYF36_017646 [Acer negundo]
MVEKASYSFERSHDDLEAFQVGPLGEQKGREWSYKSKGAITGIMISCDNYAVVSYVFKVGPLKEEDCIKVGPWGWSRSSTEEELSYMLNGATEIKIGYNGDSIKCMFFKSLDGKGEKKSLKTNTSYEKHEDCSCNKEVTTKAGPFGSQGGTEWNYKPNGAITEITISHGWVIDSLSFKTVNKNGKSEYSDKFGGEGGDSDLMELNMSNLARIVTNRGKLWNQFK